MNPPTPPAQLPERSSNSVAPASDSNYALDKIMSQKQRKVMLAAEQAQAAENNHAKTADGNAGNGEKNYSFCETKYMPMEEW